jgi:hypothetical protein
VISNNNGIRQCGKNGIMDENLTLWTVWSPGSRTKFQHGIALYLGMEGGKYKYTPYNE